MRYKLIKLLKLFFSFSWEGEDKIFMDLVAQGIMPKKGRYLSIGAHHPVKANNTLMLYILGWSGINIDIVNKWKFKLLRPRDRFIYGYVEADKSFYFDKKLFTSDSEIAKDRKEKGWVCKEKQVPFIPANFTDYDLLDLDVDGIEKQILTELLKHHKPSFICIENILPEQKGVNEILEAYGYRKAAQTLHNGIYVL